MSRKKVGLIFSYDERWIAGAYYVMNLVHAIGRLSDEEKPVLVIFTYAEGDFIKLREETNYPFLELRIIKKKREASGLVKIITARVRKYLGIDLLQPLPETRDIVFVFPVNYNDMRYFPKLKRKIFWIPDFQEHFYPQFFTEKEVERRKAYQSKLSQERSEIVFSSETALKHYRDIFPGNVSKNTVIRFAVWHKKICDDRSFLLNEYRINGPYFICSNQFWMHKNHRLVLDAAKLLFDQGISTTVLLTGAPTDFRNPEFYNSLVSRATALGLDTIVRFLGLIPRDHQLGLMKYSEAIIQPSLFEGWSTVVEDGKSLNHYILASSIEVHQEQLAGYPNYQLFDPQRASELAALMTTRLAANGSTEYYDYTMNIGSFSRNFKMLING